jgi:hypothetical protein
MQEPVPQTRTNTFNWMLYVKLDVNAFSKTLHLGQKQNAKDSSMPLSLQDPVMLFAATSLTVLAEAFETS